MSIKAFKAEHKELAKLSVKRPSLIKREAKEQGKELRQVMKKVKKLRLK